MRKGRPAVTLRWPALSGGYAGGIESRGHAVALFCGTVESAGLKFGVILGGRGGSLAALGDRRLQQAVA